MEPKQKRGVGVGTAIERLAEEAAEAAEDLDQRRGGEGQSRGDGDSDRSRGDSGGDVERGGDDEDRGGRG